MGAFVDADGKVLGKPFLIGTHSEATPPAGAFAITLGINDVKFAGNRSSSSCPTDAGPGT